MTRRFALHPFLLAIYPVLFLYSQNVEYVAPSQVAVPLVVVLVGVAGVVGIAWLVFREHRRAALAASLLAVLFFSYGHVWQQLLGVEIGGFDVDWHVVLLPAWGLLALGGIFGVAKLGRVLGDVTRIVNLVGVALLLIALVPIVGFFAREGFRATEAPQIVRAEDGPTDVEDATGAGAAAADLAAQIDDPAPENMRDIYYLMPDRYGAQRTLEEVFDYDNSAFLEGLGERGFYVAEESLANYPNTAHSLASSSNMRYLDFLTEEVGEESSSWHHLHAVMQWWGAARFAQELGYEHHHIGSWYLPSAAAHTADVNYHYDPRSEFVMALQETTLLLPLGQWMGTVYDRFDSRRHHYNEVLFQFDLLQELAEQPGPKFVFAHILTPHEPFAFNRDGSYRPSAVEERLSHEENFVDQVVHANDRFEETIDALLAGPEEEHPIIIIQADEGPHPHRQMEEDDTFVWEDATDEELRMKFPILNAVYLPGVEDPALYPELSPVNLFRLVFDAYFDAGLGLLEDRSYVFPDYEHLYRFIDVTDRVRD